MLWLFKWGTEPTEQPTSGWVQEIVPKKSHSPTVIFVIGVLRVYAAAAKSNNFREILRG